MPLSPRCRPRRQKLTELQTTTVLIAMAVRNTLEQLDAGDEEDPFVYDTF